MASREEDVGEGDVRGCCLEKVILFRSFLVPTVIEH